MRVHAWRGLLKRAIHIPTLLLLNKSSASWGRGVGGGGERGGPRRVFFSRVSGYEITITAVRVRMRMRMGDTESSSRQVEYSSTMVWGPAFILIYLVSCSSITSPKHASLFFSPFPPKEKKKRRKEEKKKRRKEEKKKRRKEDKKKRRGKKTKKNRKKKRKKKKKKKKKNK